MPEILTRKMSDLLDLALDDVIACELNPRVIVDAHSYFLFNDPPNKSSKVGIVGAVMLRRNLVTEAVPNRVAPFSPNACAGNESQLWAIEDMRGGSFRAAYASLTGVETPRKHARLLLQLSRKVLKAFMEDLGCAPWPVYRKCARELRKAGL